MARKTGQSSRSKKSTKSMRAVATPKAEPLGEASADQEVAAPVARAMSAASPTVTRPALRQGRPYQHRKSSPTARTSGASTFTITKDQEYAFIREDLRRLLMTAGVLIVVMIALLFAIGR